MYHEDIFYPFLPMSSTFDVKMVNVVENAECFGSSRFQLGEGPSRGLPRDYEPSDGHSFQALITSVPVAG